MIQDVIAFTAERIASFCVEPKRRMLYDEIHSKLMESGLDLDLFYKNSSYFAVSAKEPPVPLEGSHPSLLHWPISEYDGGQNLIRSLQEGIARIDHVVGGQNVIWIDSPQWHSTVFSPIQSSDPAEISTVDTDFRDVAKKEVSGISVYTITFTRLSLTIDGTILALGYASTSDLNSLRKRLSKAIEHGHASKLIHLSLGHLVCLPSSDALDHLNQYLCNFLSDCIIIGQMQVNFLSYAMYFGPFLEMRIELIERLPVKLPAKPSAGAGSVGKGLL
jgi:hypothetical protein